MTDREFALDNAIADIKNLMISEDLPLGEEYIQAYNDFISLALLRLEWIKETSHDANGTEQ